MTPIAVTATLPTGKRCPAEIKIRSLRNDNRDIFVEIGIWYGNKLSGDRVIFPLSLAPYVLKGIRDAKRAGWLELEKTKGE